MMTGNWCYTPRVHPAFGVPDMSLIPRTLQGGECLRSAVSTAIIIFMNYNDHDPPHFHARYEDQEITIEILSGITRGQMSKRALRMLFEWSEMHLEELMENWRLARERKSLKKIAPLP
jgi:hypothetical protein